MHDAFCYISFTFYGERTLKRKISFFLFLNSPSEFNSRKIRQHLTNCENWNNRDKVWNGANSFSLPLPPLMLLNLSRTVMTMVVTMMTSLLVQLTRNFLTSGVKKRTLISLSGTGTHGIIYCRTLRGYTYSNMPAFSLAALMNSGIKLLTSLESMLAPLYFSWSRSVPFEAVEKHSQSNNVKTPLELHHFYAMF